MTVIWRIAVLFVCIHVAQGIMTNSQLFDLSGTNINQNFENPDLENRVEELQDQNYLEEGRAINPITPTIAQFGDFVGSLRSFIGLLATAAAGPVDFLRGFAPNWTQWNSVISSLNVVIWLVYIGAVIEFIANRKFMAN